MKIFWSVRFDVLSEENFQNFWKYAKLHFEPLKGIFWMNTNIKSWRIDSQLATSQCLEKRIFFSQNCETCSVRQMSFFRTMHVLRWEVFSHLPNRLPSFSLIWAVTWLRNDMATWPSSWILRRSNVWIFGKGIPKFCTTVDSVDSSFLCVRGFLYVVVKLAWKFLFKNSPSRCGLLVRTLLSFQCIFQMRT